jgi:hypothetical protein
MDQQIILSVLDGCVILWLLDEAASTPLTMEFKVMKSSNFSAHKFVKSLCLLLLVSVAPMTVQAQDATHTTTYALWEVEGGSQLFSLWNKASKQYADVSTVIQMKPTAGFNNKMEKLSGGAVQVKNRVSNTDVTLACCQGSDNSVYPEKQGTDKDDLIFEEVAKDIFRIKFKYNGAYLTTGSRSGVYYVYGTTTKMGDEQLWMITGR